MSSAVVENVIDKFDKLTRKPVKFLTVQEDVKDDIKNLVKSLYDFTKSQENVDKKEQKSALPELIIEDFDEEQIWQEIELQNTECWDHLVWEVANCISAKDALLFPVETSQNEEKEDEEIQESENIDDDDDNMSDNDMETEKNSTKRKDKKQKFKSSIVDDKFFKLKQMEQFLLKEEKNEGKADKDSDDESIDMFEDMDSESEEEEGGKEMMYDDFFDEQDENDAQEKPQEYDGQESNESQEEDQEMPEKIKSKKKDKKRVKFAGVSSDDDTDSDDNETATEPTHKKPVVDEKKSDFEWRQQRLQQTITRLEQKTLADAPWQLKGEIDATKRPQNSLLQEVVDFDLTSRPAPIITEETTITLEDIIKQRVKDKAWDDVVKKQKPVDDQLNFRKQEILDQSKSKLSLAQVYEAEYLKQKQALSGEQEDEKEPEEHTKIREAMSKLFTKLDALSHYHYTPRAPQAEVKIVSNTPAISMEEVAPVATSDATLLAPEEVKKKRKGDLMSKEERSETDKKRERRKKKNLQRKKGQVQKVTVHKNTTKGVEASDKSLKTSKAFFQQLNDDSTSLIKKKKNIKNKGQ